ERARPPPWPRAHRAPSAAWSQGRLVEGEGALGIEGARVESPGPLLGRFRREGRKLRSAHVDVGKPAGKAGQAGERVEPRGGGGRGVRGLPGPPQGQDTRR